MGYAAGGAGAAAVAAAAIAEAIKASGAIIRVHPEDFERMLEKVDEALVVHAESGAFRTKYEYMTSYRGFIFYTKSPLPLRLPAECETIRAKKIWTPG